MAVRLKYIAPLLIEDAMPPELLQRPALSGHEVIEEVLHGFLELEFPVATTRQEHTACLKGEKSIEY